MLKELEDALRDRVTAACGLRDQTSASRGATGERPLAVLTCLGPGRCLIPNSDKRGETCAFCVQHHGTSKPADIEAHVRRVINGN